MCTLKNPKQFLLYLFVSTLPAAGVAYSNTEPESASYQSETNMPRRLEIGRFQARALLQCTKTQTSGGALAILLPGSGAHGPEEAMPGFLTADGKETQILTSFAQGLRAAGFHTLQLGKPGIEFHTDWNPENLAYDAHMFMSLTWRGAMDNVNDAVDKVLSEHLCGASSIVIVGHSEGTSLAADVARENFDVQGLIFLGLQGWSVKQAAEWQLYERSIDYVIRPLVDANQDGVITRAEAAPWGEDFNYPWKKGEENITIAMYAQSLRSDPEYRAMLESLAQQPIYGDGIWDREPQFTQMAELTIPIVAFTGNLDAQTPVTQLAELEEACRKIGKENCETYVALGLGHFFSAPRPPRANMLLDGTTGPVSLSFLQSFAQKMSEWRVKHLVE